MTDRRVKGALPELRQDLHISSAAFDLSGQRYWKIHDPLHNRYTALSRMHMAMLDVWPQARVSADIVDAVWQRHGEIISLDDVADFATFLLASGLARSQEPGSWRRGLANAEKRRTAYVSRLVHTYLFFKIPVFDPARFLTATLPFVRPFGSRSCVIALVALACLNVMLVLREWDQFVSSAVRLASWSGMIGLLPSIIAVKLLHEFAHGYVAAHYGCRVPSMGVAIVIGVPLLYVDVSDSWKLSRRRAQVAIDGAGIAMDVAVSIIAATAWVFLPDGGVRSLAFNLATAGLLTSLTFNLNPFMKFDGYHLIADAIGMPNLQARAMELARWRLRETLFGIGALPPEHFSPRTRRALVAYGVLVWIYRAIMFTGIALLVYAYFFKVLGLILFVVEIIYFLLWPICSELTEWRKMRGKLLATRRTRLTLALSALAIAALAMPWSSTVRIPAVLEPVAATAVHVPVAARMTAIHALDGDSVEQAAPLFSLVSRSLAHDLETTILRGKLVELRLDRIASLREDRDDAAVMRLEHAALQEKAIGIRRQLAELNVAAPMAGLVSSAADYRKVGRWVTPNEPLVVVHDDKAGRVRGLIEAGERTRVRSGAEGQFMPNNILLSSVPVVVAHVSNSNVAVIDQVALAQSFGGPVPSTLNNRRLATPTSAHYSIIATVTAETAPTNVAEAQVVGVLVVKGDPESLLARVWRRVLVVLVRESGF